MKVDGIFTTMMDYEAKGWQALCWVTSAIAIASYPAVVHSAAPGATVAAAEDEGATGSQASFPKSPLTLADLIRSVSNENPRAQSLDAQALASRQAVSAARWQFFPAPSIQMEGAGKDRELVLSLTEPVWTFGRLEADVRVARSRSSLARERTLEARYGLALRVVETWSRYATATRAIGVYRRSLERLQRLERMIERRVAAGVSAPIDLSLVRTRKAQANSVLVSLEARAASSLEAVAQLVGRPLLGGLVVLPEEGELPDFYASLALEAEAEHFIENCLRVHPLLRRANSEVTLAVSEEARSRKVQLPTIFARFDHRELSGRYSNTAFPSDRLVFGLQMSFGSGLSALANARAASAQARATALDRDATRADLAALLTEQREVWRSNGALVEALRASLGSQQQTAASYERLFLAGKRSWLDLLNMEREQTELERNLGDAEVSLFGSSYRLSIEMGNFK